MYTKIESNNYHQYINKMRVEYKYWIDVNGIWWYSYDDICELLELDNQISNKLYKCNLNEDEKCMCEDSNTDSDNIPVRKFISSDALRKLVKRNNERNNIIIKSINNLECAGTAYDIHEDNELKQRIDYLENCINEKDYEEIFYQSYKLTNSQTGREVLEKLKIIDKDKEELIDQIREELYNPSLLIDDYDEMEVTLCKRKDNVTETSTCIKTKDNNCPEWIRNIVK